MTDDVGKTVMLLLRICGAPATNEAAAVDRIRHQSRRCVQRIANEDNADRQNRRWREISFDMLCNGLYGTFAITERVLPEI